MAVTGGDMNIAIGIQDLTQNGINRILKQLSKVPSSLVIDIDSAKGDLKSITKLNKNLYQAGEIAKKLQETLNGEMGKDAFKGLLADAKRFERSMKNVESAAASLSKLKMSYNTDKLKSEVVTWDKGRIESELKSVQSRMTQMLPELDKSFKLYSRAEMNSQKNLGQRKSAFEALKREFAELQQREKTLKWGSLRVATQNAAQFRSELNNVQVAMGSTSQFASQLREDIQQAFGYYALKQFLGNLIEIGGQFEYQRRAIANILQDGTKANALFNQIKELGVKSPFSTLELDSYAKQLSAFEIPYHKMYDTLKKLADISAGTGADMSRIILAYGHVKSEGYLTGIQRMQFSNANINIVGGLAKYYTEQEGQQVSRRDVYKRIHDKQVTFEDMETVLLGMAEPGGQFYNMQEEMAGTVKGVFKNLSDAWNHVLMSIEQSAGGPLMFFGETFTKILNLIEKFPSTAARFVTAMSVMAGVRALNLRALNKEALATVKRITLLDKERIALNKNKKAEIIGSGGILKGQALSKNAADEVANLIKVGGAEGYATKQAVLHGIARRKLNKELAFYLVRVGAITAAEARAAIASRTLWGTIKTGANAAGVAVKGFMATLWPMLAITLAIEGVMWIWDEITNTEGEERKIEANKRLEDSYNSLKNAIEELPDKQFEGMYSDELFETTKQMIDTIKDNLAESELILGRVYAKDKDGSYLHSTLEQAIMIREELERAANIREDLKDDAHLYAEEDEGGAKEVYDAYKEKYDELEKYVATNYGRYFTPLYNLVQNDRKLQEVVKDVEKGDRIGYIMALAQNREFVTSKKNKENREYAAIAVRGSVVLEAYDELVEYALELGSKFKKVSEGKFDNIEDVYTATMAAIGNLDLDDNAKQLISKIVTKELFPGQYEGVYNGSIKNPNAIYDKIFEYLNAQKEKGVGAFSFDIKREDSLSNMFKAFAENYKALYDDAEILVKSGFLPIQNVPLKLEKLPIKQGSTDEEKQSIEEYNKIAEMYQNLVGAITIAGFDLDAISYASGVDKSWLKELEETYVAIKNAKDAFKNLVDAGEVPTQAIALLMNRGGYSKVLTGLVGKKNPSIEDFNLMIGKLKTDNYDRLVRTHEGRTFIAKINKESDKILADSMKATYGFLNNNMEEKYGLFIKNLELYNKLFSITGDHKGASAFTFGKTASGNRVMYDTMLKEFFNTLMKSYGYNFKYEELEKLKVEEWEQIPKNIKDLFEDFKKNIQQWSSQIREDYVESLKSDKSYEAERKRIEAEYQTEIERNKIIFGVGTTEVREADNKTNARKRLSLTELNVNRSGVLENPSLYDTHTINRFLKPLIVALREALKYGLIDDTTYSKRLTEIYEAKSNARLKNYFGLNDRRTELIDGGLPAYLKRIRQDYLLTLQHPDIFKDTNGSIKRRYQRWYGDDENRNGWIAATRAMNDFIASLRRGSNMVSNFSSITSSVISLTGGSDDRLTSSLTAASGIAGGVSTALSGLANLDFNDAAKGMAQIAQAAENFRKEREAEKKEIYNLAVQRIQNEISDIERSKKRGFGQSFELDSQKLEKLQQQEAEIQEHYRWLTEDQKKNRDENYNEQVKGQLDAIKDEIKHFWADAFKENFGLDFKEIANRLTDALTTAFKNGEDAALAWKKTVGDIVRELAVQVVRTKIVEPLMSSAYDYFFGEGGLFVDKKDFTEDDVNLIGDYLMGLGIDDAVNQSSAFWQAIEKKFPYSSDSESVGGLTRLGEQLTEETGSVIASYLNSIRADVGANRKHLNEVVEKGIPALENINLIAQSQLTQLEGIATNTERTAIASEAIIKFLEDSNNGDKFISVN